MSKNIIKIRDARAPTELECSQVNGGLEYTVSGGNQKLSWISMPDNKLSLSDLRNGIEPWLTSLFQSEHLSLLVGNGLSIAIHNLAAGRIFSAMNKPNISSRYNQKIESAVKASVLKNHRGEANIEDYVRVMNELLQGLRILGDTTAHEELQEEINGIINAFSKQIIQLENDIVAADETKKIEAFNYLVSFLMSFASRTGTRDRLNIFTTNYDRVIEAGAEIAGLHLIDRFIGMLAPIFRSSRLDIDMHYNPPGIRGEPRYLEGVARFTKLHGSVDWLDSHNDIRRVGLTFGAGSTSIDSSSLMIYPNSSKDRETAEYPFVELFRDLAAALCRPNSTLVTYGYSFGDEHINRIIRDMLTIPSTHLVIIAFDDSQGRIMRNYELMGRPTQISLLVGKDLANIKTLVDCFLPKPSIDKATMRMSELITQRMTIKSSAEPDDSNGGISE